MSEKSFDIKSVLPYAVIAGMLVYYFGQQQQQPDKQPKSVASITASVFRDQRKAYAEIFEDAAKQVDAKSITTDRQLLDWMRPKTEAARLEARKPFDAMIEASIPESFVGHESEVATLLRKVAKSW